MDVPTCADDPGYPEQHYSSANAECEDATVNIDQTPILNTHTSTYEVPANSILCNGMLVVHPAITGSATVAALYAELNTKLAALGTWSQPVPGTLRLATTACQTLNIPWQDSP